MGIGQALVDEVPRRERRRVELAGREEHLAVAAVDPVPIVVHRDEIVVRADLLKLPERLQEGVPVPQAHVVDRRAVGLDVVQGERGLAAEVPDLDVVDVPGPAGRRDVVLQLRALALELVRCDQELLDSGGDDTPEQRHDEGEGDGDHGVAGEAMGSRAEQHETAADQCGEPRHVQERHAGDEVGVAGAHQGARRGEHQGRDLHEEHVARRQDEEQRDQHREVAFGRRLDGDVAPDDDDVAAQQVQRHDQEQRQDREPDQEPQDPRHHRKGEDVVADVPAEHGVGDIERRLVEEPQHHPPAGSAARADQGGQQEGHGRRQPAQQPGDVELRQVGADADHQRIGHHPPLGEPQVTVEEDEGDDPDARRHGDSRPEAGQEDRLEAEGLIPIPVDQEADQRGKARETDQEEDDQGDEGRAAFHRPDCRSE